MPMADPMGETGGEDRAVIPVHGKTALVAPGAHPSLNDKIEKVRDGTGGPRPESAPQPIDARLTDPDFTQRPTDIRPPRKIQKRGLR